MSTFFFLERRTWRQHGVLEFRIDQTAGGNPFPLPGMTENNWEAHLNGIVVQNGPPGAIFQLSLYNLNGYPENGAIAETDYDCGQDFVETISLPFLDRNESNRIDVTEQLRRDLFGTGSGDATSGFVFNRLVRVSGYIFDARSSGALPRDHHGWNPNSRSHLVARADRNPCSNAIAGADRHASVDTASGCIGGSGFV